MIVVSDTTAITSLLKIGEERLLKEQFGTVIVPRAVWNELLVFHTRLPDFIVLKPVSASDSRVRGTETLGRGEAEAIKLAKEIGADLLLVDDHKARTSAESSGIKCTGLLAVIVQAKRDGRLASVGTAIESLEKSGGLYLSERVKAAALRLGDETQS